MDHGAECDVKDFKDYTPLFYAAKTEGIEAAYYLLEHGKADPNFQCTNGKTPMFKATTYEDAMLMMKYGADESITMNPDPETNSNVGRTALEYLVENCYDDSPIAILDNDVSKDEDDTMTMNLSLPKKASEKTEFGLHETFSDCGRFDLFMHPIMEVFMDLKWRKFKRIFVLMLLWDFIFAASISYSGYRFVVMNDCKVADEVGELELCKNIGDFNSSEESTDQCHYFFMRQCMFRFCDRKMGFVTKQSQKCSFFSKTYLGDENVKLESTNNCNREQRQLQVTCEKGTLRTEGKSLAPLCAMRGLTSIYTCFTFDPFIVIIYICLVDRIVREILDLLAHRRSYFGNTENYLQILIVCSTIGNVYH